MSNVIYLGSLSHIMLFKSYVYYKKIKYNKDFLTVALYYSGGKILPGIF